MRLKKARCNSMEGDPAFDRKVELRAKRKQKKFKTTLQQLSFFRNETDILAEANKTDAKPLEQ
jgi:hypothetical protein